MAHGGASVRGQGVPPSRCLDASGTHNSPPPSRKKAKLNLVTHHLQNDLDVDSGFEDKEIKLGHPWILHSLGGPFKGHLKQTRNTFKTKP